MSARLRPVAGVILRRRSSSSEEHMSSMIPGAAERATKKAEQVTAGYTDPQHERPLAAYSLVTAAFGGVFAGSLLAARRRGHELPGAIETRDIVLWGLATHKLTRLISKDRVTSFLRAPFTEYQDRTGHGELEEKARGHGVRLALGELLVCPYCLGQWVVGGFAVGAVAAPRLTRLLAAMWTAEAIADAAQLAYETAERRS
jgi:hypothetical protein